MGDRRRLTEELDDFERSLAALTPSAGGVDRDQLMFLAGRASATTAAASSGRLRWFWPSAAAASTLAAAVLAILWVVEIHRQPPLGPPPVAERRHPEDRQTAAQNAEQRVGAPDARQPSRDLSGSQAVARLAAALLEQPSYLRLQQMALAFGVEALPLPVSPGSPDGDRAMSYWEESRRLLEDETPSEQGAEGKTGFLGRALFFNPGDTL
jgi:hypothetical protein